MLNKDKRSLVFCLALGDGCLHYTSAKNKLGKASSGSITIAHGMEQADYQAWKAQLLSQIFNREVKVRPHNRGNSNQVSVCSKRIRAWRKFTYRDNNKSIPLMLKFIRHPEMALFTWLADDGYVQHNSGNNPSNGAKFRLFTCDQTPEQHVLMIKWFEDNFQVSPKVFWQKNNKTGKTYPYLKFNCEESLKLWKIIRALTMSFKSLKHKFRYIEQKYLYESVTASTTR